MDADELTLDPDSFSGQVRLFPLPNLVLFPHVIQPLQIFEPRYQALLKEALATDKLIAMAVLAPGWQNDYEGRPPIYPIGCLGRIAAHSPLPEGRHNILLMGLQRIRLLNELPADKPFRECRVELLDDVYPATGSARRAVLHASLLAAFKRTLVKLPEAQEHLDHLLGNDVALGMLTDLVSHTVELEAELKIKLLAETDVDQRARWLLAGFDAMAGNATALAAASSGSRYPPDFSVN